MRSFEVMMMMMIMMIFVGVRYKSVCISIRGK